MPGPTSRLRLERRDDALLVEAYGPGVGREITGVRVSGGLVVVAEPPIRCNAVDSEERPTARPREFFGPGKHGGAEAAVAIYHGEAMRVKRTARPVAPERVIGH